MAERIVFVPENNGTVREISVEFSPWAGGFAISQKQKNIATLHNAFNNTSLGKEKVVLEVSTKSTVKEGVALSAFNLQKYVPSLCKSVPLECVFQSAKVFESGGPYLDILEKSAKEAKSDERLKTSGRIIAFEFDGVRYPINPPTLFYDSMYLEALSENPDIAECILKYDAFTDIEFNPKKSLNCQARSCALYKAKKLNG